MTAENDGKTYIIARDMAEARRIVKLKNLEPGKWVYVSHPEKLYGALPVKIYAAVNWAANKSVAEREQMREAYRVTGKSPSYVNFRYVED